MSEIKHNILSNNEMSDKYELRKRAKELSDATRPQIQKMRTVRVDSKTTILVKLNWTDDRVNKQIEKVKKSMM